MIKISRSVIASTLLVMSIVACSDATAPTSVAGTYALLSVSGASVPMAGNVGYQGGWITLEEDGSAERRVRYWLEDGETQEYVSTGTYRLVRGVVHFDFDTDTPHPVRIVDNTITLNWGTGNDGPDVLELYVLQAGVQ